MIIHLLPLPLLLLLQLLLLLLLIIIIIIIVIIIMIITTMRWSPTGPSSARRSARTPSSWAPRRPGRPWRGRGCPTRSCPTSGAWRTPTAMASSRSASSPALCTSRAAASPAWPCRPSCRPSWGPSWTPRPRSLPARPLWQPTPRLALTWPHGPPCAVCALSRASSLGRRPPQCDWLLKTIMVYFVVILTWITVVILELRHAPKPEFLEGPVPLHNPRCATSVIILYI